MKKLLKNIRYLFEYIVILIALKILGLLGIDKSVNICRYLAKKIGPLLPVHKLAINNIQNISNLNIPTQIIINQVWNNFGAFIGEWSYVNKMSEEELSKRVEIIGLDNIIELQKSQQPFLLFTGHFANWELVPAIINKFYPKFAIVYRKLNNPYIDKLINDTRKTSNIKLIPKGEKGARDLISAIKSEYAICMLVDQKMNNGIEVPFLGHPAMTAHAIAKIALQFGRPIIPLQLVRTNSNNDQNTSYFKAIIHKPILLQKTFNHKLDCYNIMLIINQILGNWVYENPGQWFWFHNRWKKNNYPDAK